MTRLIAPLLLLLTLLSACQKPASDFIDDRAGLLTHERRWRIADIHRQLLTDLDLHLKIVILDQPVADLDAVALRQVAAGKVGGDTKGARGVLLLVDPAGKQVRLEIGDDLEPLFTDAFVGRIEREQMTPFFAAGRVGDGVEATVGLLVAQVLQVAPATTGSQGFPQVKGQ